MTAPLQVMSRQTEKQQQKNYMQEQQKRDEGMRKESLLFNTSVLHFALIFLNELEGMCTGHERFFASSDRIIALMHLKKNKLQ